jgi:hypothetical protein
MAIMAKNFIYVFGNKTIYRWYLVNDKGIYIKLCMNKEDYTLER